MTNNYREQGIIAKFFLISASGFRALMLRFDPPKKVIYDNIKIAKEGDSDTLQQVSQTLATVGTNDVFNYLIDQADRLNASDIHIENQRDTIRVRMRVDGALHSVAELGRLAAVSGRTVRSWEDPRAWVPDRTAWMAVESLWRDADRMASGLVAGAPAGPVTLPYGTGASTLACIASRIAAGRLSAAGVAWNASFPHAPGPDGGKARFRLMTDMLHAGVSVARPCSACPGRR